MENNKDSLRKYRICLTGGPCAGKTTGMTILANHFENLGWKVYCVQEIAELVFRSGIVYADLHTEQVNQFQRNLIYSLLALEKIYFDLAKLCKKNCLVICDRGIIDVFVHTPESVRMELMKENNWSHLDIRDNRYDIVLHLVTAACKAEKFYERTEIRKELPQQAKQQDILVAQEWMAHPRYYVIGNDTNLDGKLKRAIFVISEQLGIPFDKDTSKGNFSLTEGIVIDLANMKKKSVKFIVSSLPDDSVFPKFEDYNIVCHFLSTKQSNVIESIQKRGKNDGYSYYHKVRRVVELENVSNVVKEKKKLEHNEYLKMLMRKSPRHNVIFMKQRHFIWKGKLYHLDIFIQPRTFRVKNLILLKSYSSLNGDGLLKSLPDFLNVTRNVSDDLNYKRYNLSRKFEKHQENEDIFQSIPSYGHDNLVCF